MRRATLALGLRSTAQSVGVIARELGIFAAHGVELRIAREETAGPEGAAGLMNGEFQFAELGAVPLVQAALDGGDPLILLAVEPVSALYVIARRGVESVPALDGGALGVLSEAGQTGYSAQRMLERWGLAGRVKLAALQTYPAIFAALRDGRIEAGVLTADYRIAGELAYGFHVLADLGQEFGYQGPVLATTRRVREREPDTVAAVVAAYAEAIHVFKSEPARVVPILRRHLGFVSDEQAAAIQRFYAPRFQAKPLVSASGLARVIASLREQAGPAARKLEPHDVYDDAFVHGAVQTTT